LRNACVRGADPTAVDVNSFAPVVGGHVAKELLLSLDRRDRQRAEAVFRPARTSCAARRSSSTANCSIARYVINENRKIEQVGGRRRHYLAAQSRNRR
jgi:hypothetical protein